MTVRRPTGPRIAVRHPIQHSVRRDAWTPARAPVYFSELFLQPDFLQPDFAAPFLQSFFQPKLLAAG
ncbi:hypothetical protein, partial [Achromobacter sp. AGC39]